MKNNRTKKIVLTSMFASIIFIATYILKINFTSNAYFHLGDSMILLCTVFLPSGYAAIAVSGACLADLLSGFAIYIPFTLIIKALMTLVLTNKGRIVSPRNVTGALLSALINILGYYTATSIIFNTQTAIINIPWDIAQSLCSIVLFFILGFVTDKTNLKNKLFI